MHPAASSAVRFSPSRLDASATSSAVSFWKKNGVTIVLPYGRVKRVLHGHGQDA